MSRFGHWLRARPGRFAALFAPPMTLVAAVTSLFLLMVASPSGGGSS